MQAPGVRPSSTFSNHFSSETIKLVLFSLSMASIGGETNNCVLLPSNKNSGC